MYKTPKKIIIKNKNKRSIKLNIIKKLKKIKIKDT
jgi:hypothetical protein